MCSIFQHSPNYSSCPWLVLATYSSTNTLRTQVCWTVSSLVALTVSYMFNIWTRLIYLYFRSSSWTTVTSWLTHEFFVPDDENYIWLEAPWRSWVLIRVSFLPSVSTVCPPPAIFLVILAIRWEGMWTAPEKVARPHISHHLIGRIERTGMSS